MNDLYSRCSNLLDSWVVLKNQLQKQVGKDRAEGLVRTAEAIDCSILTLRGCIAGLEEALEEGKRIKK